MTIRSRPKIVLLGMMSRIPVAGNVWLVLQYLIGLVRLGFDVYYVEAHGCTPREFMRHANDDGWSRAAAFIDGVMRRFDLGRHWAYHARHGDERVYGMDPGELRRLYASAALLINLHGGTEPLPEHSATGRLVYLGTDPVELEIEIHNGVPKTLAFLDLHCAFFTWGINSGRPDCTLPASPRHAFQPTLPPVVLDFWGPAPSRRADRAFTTIGNWRQLHRVVRFQGKEYSWSKHFEFLKVLDLPRRTGRGFELALSSYDEDDQRLLEHHGWTVRPARTVSDDLDAYRHYLARSWGEFTVAKEQNVSFRTGWFSERSASYLATGRPVITQETGFSNVLPTGAGLFGFSTLGEAEAAVAAIDADHDRHCRAAWELAHDHFRAEIVLGKMIDYLGI